MTDTALQARRPRADAERNRRALLDAAVEVFAEEGLDASVAVVARRAGVGQGTAFRHYPSKERLVAACVGHCLERIAGVATAMLSEPDPLEALRSFMRTAAEMQSANRGLIEAVGSEGVLAEPDVRVLHERLLDTVGRLLRRAQDAGVVRDDVVAEDIGVLMGAVGFAGASLSGEAPEAWKRYFDLVFDALRPGAAALEVPAPTREQLARAKGIASPDA